MNKKQLFDSVGLDIIKDYVIKNKDFYKLITKPELIKLLKNKPKVKKINIDKLIKDYKSDVSPTTIEVYKRDLKRAYKIITGKDEEPKDLNWLSSASPEKVKEVFEKEIKNELTRKSTYNILVVFLKSLGIDDQRTKKYGEYRDKLIEKYNKKGEDNIKNKKQSENWISKKKLEDLLSKLKKESVDIYGKKSINNKDKHILKQYILLLIHLKYPLRNDLGNVKVISNIDDINKKDNFIFKDTIILNQYKTSKTYGQLRIKLTKDIYSQVQKYLNFLKPKYLIEDGFNKTHTNSQGIYQIFKSLFKKEFNKNISTTMLRHVIPTEDLGEYLKKSKKLAKDMGHSRDTQSKYILYN